MSEGGLHTMQTEGHGTVHWVSSNNIIRATGDIVLFGDRIEVALSEHAPDVKAGTAPQGMVFNFPAASSFVVWHQGPRGQ